MNIDHFRNILTQHGWKCIRRLEGTRIPGVELEPEVLFWYSRGDEKTLIIQSFGNLTGGWSIYFEGPAEVDEILEMIQ